MFDLAMDKFFGGDDLNGTDGTVFGLQPFSTSIDRAGESIGIGGGRFAPAIQFDTYRNFDRNDPTFHQVSPSWPTTKSPTEASYNLAGPRTVQYV